MTPSRNTVRLLGVAFLTVFVASILSDALHNAAAGTGNMSDILASIADHATMMRISNLVALAVQSTGIIVLAVLLYVVLSSQSKIVARVVLGWWLAEAITLAVSKIGSSALIPRVSSSLRPGPRGRPTIRH